MINGVTTSEDEKSAKVKLSAKIAIGATLVFMIALILLHFIKPELDPSWRFISEYAIGDYGWMMTIAFFIWAISYLALYKALQPHIKDSRSGKFGLALLWVSAAGLILAGLFVTDPITASDTERTISGMIHGIGGTLGMAMPVAAILITIALRKNPNFAEERNALIWPALVAGIGFLFSLVSIGLMLGQSEGKFGPTVLVGWPNRIEVAGYCIWMLMIAQQSIKQKMRE
jgi:Sec61beta family.